MDNLVFEKALRIGCFYRLWRMFLARERSMKNTLAHINRRSCHCHYIFARAIRLPMWRPDAAIMRRLEVDFSRRRLKARAISGLTTSWYLRHQQAVDGRPQRHAVGNIA